MKSHAKISCAAVALSVMASSVYAESNKTFRQKMSGFEFGVGAPLVTPLTGYNIFVGYVNKNADSFFGRRFGIRADFTIPSALRVKGTVSDNPSGDGYLADAHGKLMGFDIEMSDFSDKKIEIDSIKDDRDNPILIGQNAADLTLELKNKNIGAIIDFYPFGNTWFLGGLRFSGGYYIGDLNLSAFANINNDIDYTYNVGHGNDTIQAQIEAGSRIGADFRWKYHGPYAGFGFDLGIWRGVKLFMDAGVVFAKAPTFTTNDIHDKDFVIKGCYRVNGQPCSTNMVTILQGANKPDVDQIVHDTVGQAVRDTLNTYATEYASVIALIPGFATVDPSTLGDDIINFLNDDSTAPWINDLITNNGGTDLNATISDIKQEWHANADDATDGIQNDINKAWDDYEKAKSDAIKDVNDFLDDYGIVPTVKIGFMYRF